MDTRTCETEASKLNTTQGHIILTRDKNTAISITRDKHEAASTHGENHVVSITRDKNHVVSVTRDKNHVVSVTRDKNHVVSVTANGLRKTISGTMTKNNFGSLSRGVFREGSFRRED